MVEKSKKSRFFRGAFWGHKTPKIPKIPKIPKTPPDWPLNGFWVSSNQFWPVLVPYETHFCKEGGFLLREFLGEIVLALFKIEPRKWPNLAHVEAELTAFTTFGAQVCIQPPFL